MKRDAAMLSLVALSRLLAAHLESLGPAERDAVVALIRVSQQIAAYGGGARPDQEIVDDFERTLATLSPMPARFDARPPAPRCLARTIGATALVREQCGGRKSRPEYERDAAARMASEIVRMTERIEELKQAIRRSFRPGSRDRVPAPYVRKPEKFS